MNNGKIYCLKDPETNKIRYVGFTRSKLNTRLSQHKHEALKRNKLSHVYNWFRACEKKGMTPEISLLESNIPIEKWEDRENFWINKFTNLTNQKSGGQGIHNNNNGSGRISSINHKKKTIVQVNDEGILINEWNSSVDAEKHFNGKHTGNIFSSIKNGSKAFGFYWFKKEDFVPGVIPKRKLEKPISLYCLYTNKLIKKYKSMTLLSKDIDCNNSNIIQAIKKNLILKNFYYARYSNEENINPPEKKPIFYNNGKYYNNFNQLYKEGNFKLGLGSLKKRKNDFIVKEINEKILKKLRKVNE